MEWICVELMFIYCYYFILGCVILHRLLSSSNQFEILFLFIHSHTWIISVKMSFILEKSSISIDSEILFVSTQFLISYCQVAVYWDFIMRSELLKWLHDFTENVHVNFEESEQWNWVLIDAHFYYQVLITLRKIDRQIWWQIDNHLHLQDASNKTHHLL